MRKGKRLGWLMEVVYYELYYWKVRSGLGLIGTFGTKKNCLG